MLSNVRDAYSRYVKDNEEQQKLIKNTDAINAKRSSDVEHERLEKEIQLMNEQKNLQEELIHATKMLEEGSVRLSAAINNKKFDDISTGEVIVTAANAKLAILKTQLIENNENLNQLRKKTEKMNDSNKYYLNIIFPFLLKYFTNIFIYCENKLIIIKEPIITIQI